MKGHRSLITVVDRLQFTVDVFEDFVLFFRLLARFRSGVERLLLTPEVRATVQVIDPIRSQLIDRIARLRIGFGHR